MLLLLTYPWWTSKWYAGGTSDVTIGSSNIFCASRPCRPSLLTLLAQCPSRTSYDLWCGMVPSHQPKMWWDSRTFRPRHPSWHWHGQSNPANLRWWTRYGHSTHLVVRGLHRDVNERLLKLTVSAQSAAQVKASGLGLLHFSTSRHFCSSCLPTVYLDFRCSSFLSSLLSFAFCSSKSLHCLWSTTTFAHYYPFNTHTVHSHYISSSWIKMMISLSGIIVLLSSLLCPCSSGSSNFAFSTDKLLIIFHFIGIVLWCARSIIDTTRDCSSTWKGHQQQQGGCSNNKNNNSQAKNSRNQINDIISIHLGRRVSTRCRQVREKSMTESFRCFLVEPNTCPSYS